MYICRFAGSRTRPPIDPSQDITAASAELMDGTTTIRFTRPRASTDTNDISLDQCRFFLWAWGGSVTNGDPTTIGQHTSRGIFPNMVCIPDNCVNGGMQTVWLCIVRVCDTVVKMLPTYVLWSNFLPVHALHCTNLNSTERSIWHTRTDVHQFRIPVFAFVLLPRVRMRKRG